MVRTKRGTKHIFIQSKKFAPDDDTIPYRFVGSYEYLKAIDSLDKLVAASSESEMKVFDRIISEQPEFAFYSGVVSTIGPTAKLIESNADKRKQQDFKFRKSSLAWLLALARVEVASTMSMYGKSASPFEEFTPQRFGVREYLSVLFDDVAAHLNALDTDEKFKTVTDRRRQADSDTVAYMRRLKLVDDMLQPLSKSSDFKVYEPALAYRRNIKEYGKRLLNQVESATEVSVSTYETATPGKLDIEDVQHGSVTALSTLTMGCQRIFIEQFGRR